MPFSCIFVAIFFVPNMYGLKLTLIMIGEPINFTTLCLGKFKWVSNKFQPNKFSLCCKMIGFSTFSFYLLLISCIRNKDLWALRLAVKKTVFKPLIFISYFLLYLSLFSFSSKTSFSKFLVLSLSLSCLFPLITYLRFFFSPLQMPYIQLLHHSSIFLFSSS